MLLALICWSGLWPWWWAWRSNRHTTLRPALLWVLAAWAGWTVSDGLKWVFPTQDLALERYLALSLTCCGGVAVLGARRPGAEAWHFVVAGLLAILFLPVAGELLRQDYGPPRLHTANWIFLSVAVGVIVLNYLPTRLGPAAALLAVGLTVEMLLLAGQPVSEAVVCLAELGLALSPWLALACCVRPRRDCSELDKNWLAFRDRFGLVWGLRAREQFNRAAAHAGWSLALGWSGQYLIDTGTVPDTRTALTTLQAVLKRFTREGSSPSPSDERKGATGTVS